MIVSARGTIDVSGFCEPPESVMVLSVIDLFGAVGVSVRSIIIVGSTGGPSHSHWWRLLGSLCAALTVNLSLDLHLSRGILH